MYGNGNITSTATISHWIVFKLLLLLLCSSSMTTLQLLSFKRSILVTHATIMHIGTYQLAKCASLHSLNVTLLPFHMHFLFLSLSFPVSFLSICLWRIKRWNISRDFPNQMPFTHQPNKHPSEWYAMCVKCASFCELMRFHWCWYFEFSNHCLT